MFRPKYSSNEYWDVYEYKYEWVLYSESTRVTNTSTREMNTSAGMCMSVNMNEYFTLKVLE